jgi:hypothetical protein
MVIISPFIVGLQSSQTDESSVLAKVGTVIGILVYLHYTLVIAFGSAAHASAEFLHAVPFSEFRADPF